MLKNVAFTSYIVAVLFLAHPAAAGHKQTISDAEVTALVQAFKSNPRGPYESIRWFCPDGSVLPPKERCSAPGGIQHALPRKIVEKLRRNRGIYLGQILAGTPPEAFLDDATQNSRLKQYVLERYLQSIDDGWIMRRARYYRGALQAEDEAAWGEHFLTWLCSQDSLLRRQFFLVRQSVRHLPHGTDPARGDEIRALAQAIDDSLPVFSKIRIKIHSSPDEDDLIRVGEFRQKFAGRIPPAVDGKLQRLQEQLEAAYAPGQMNDLKRYMTLFPAATPVGTLLRALLREADVETQESRQVARIRSWRLANLLWAIRRNIFAAPSPALRLRLLELSTQAESILFRQIGNWQPTSTGDLLDKAFALAKASAGCGYFEVWEWEQLEPNFLVANVTNTLPVSDFLERAQLAAASVQWGAGMFRSVYQPVVNLFAGFEPLADGFIDNEIRASVLLQFGDVCARLTRLSYQKAGLSNHILDLRHENDFRGLNPGLAVGKLEVIRGAAQDVQLLSDRIYVLLQPPSDMKPVAGIATVSEGNLVSHVQLLARNLGIPNAILSQEALEELSKYQGRRILYAVSPRGSVVMKLVSELTAEEKSLTQRENRRRGKIEVPIANVQLQDSRIHSLATIRAADSGRICGPKAANLGQLKAIFPDKVVPGLVLPFGLFRRHVEQTMPGDSISYWQYVQNTFDLAAQERDRGVDPATVEGHLLQRMQTLRQAIGKMDFLPGFVEEFKRRFAAEFHAQMGELPVFIRSDTNVEDLKDFTGAGLNLTVANVRNPDKILQAIKSVWASPFSDRSLRWRQEYLLDPENAFPSILIIPTINVEKSGVLITTSLSSTSEDATVAMNWGGKGAVEGQMAETYLLRHDGRDVLLSPARESSYNYLPFSGGVRQKTVFLNEPILTRSERYKVRLLAQEIRALMPGTAGRANGGGPFDVEFGFWNDSIWLLQIRPFVQNKSANSSVYLASLDKPLAAKASVFLSEKLE